MLVVEGTAVGHQFFERLAGESARVFQFELEREAPNLGAATDAGSKTVHNRVLQLFVVGDLGRVVAAVNEALRSTPAGNPNATVSADMLGTVVDRLQTCLYRDEAQRIAVALLHTVNPQRACDIDDVIRATAQLFAEHLSRAEAVFRLPGDGLFGMQELARDLASRMAARVSENLIRQRQENPDGWRENGWRAPRARTPKPNSEEIGHDLDLSTKPKK